jgi:nitrate/nitrite-specific signal transduction histidine kinase
VFVFFPERGIILVAVRCPQNPWYASMSANAYSTRRKEKGSKRLSLTTIRSRLLVGFVLMALLPAIGISAGSVVLGYYNGQRQTLDRLQSVAALKESETGFWLDSLRHELVAPLSQEFARDRPRIVLSMVRNHIHYDFYHKATRRLFAQYVAQGEQLRELFLVDLQGRVVLSTDPEREGYDCSDQPFFQLGLVAPTTQPPFYSVAQEGSAPTPVSEARSEMSDLITAIPIHGDDGQELGVMAGRSSTERIGEILGERTGMGATGRAYLVNRDYDLLLASRFGLPEGDVPPADELVVHSQGIDAAIQGRVKGSGVYPDYRGIQVVGVYRWMPELQMALLVELEASEAFRSIATSLTVNLGIGMLAVLLAVGASLVITRGIATPLVNLVETATQVAAGDLEREARVERDDEVGTLARAFNSMTAQLRDLISHLEERVRERTRALRRRALQLETSAQVSRDLTASILDVDDLLARVVALIRDAFGYYQLHIYLLDGEGQRLLLRASSGQVGPAVQELDISASSLNSEAARSGRAVLVDDVSADPRFLADESLPDTRSELVVPLSVSGRVIGTMDVQSAVVDGFAQDDVLVIQSLGDQVAVAIENARLVGRSRELAVVQERNRMARELHDSMTQSLYSLVLFAGAGRKALQANRLERAERNLIRVEQSAQQALKEMRLLVFELRPHSLDEEGLAGALRQRLDAVENRVGITTQLSVQGQLDLPAATEEGLYRIAQEALTNALKHAFASSVRVQVSAREESVDLEVIDDGRGFDPADSAELGGLGLVSMRERAEELGGALTIVSAPGQGTRVRVTVRRERIQADA